jgi:hypothetical protein
MVGLLGPAQITELGQGFAPDLGGTFRVMEAKQFS